MAANKGSIATNASIALAAFAMGGCAVVTYAPAPTDELRLSEQVVAQARDAGAAELAPQELALAQEKLELGKRWMAAKDYKPATWLVEQARVDAELAMVRTASALARREAETQAAELRSSLRLATLRAR